MDGYQKTNEESMEVCSQTIDEVRPTQPIYYVGGVYTCIVIFLHPPPNIQSSIKMSTHTQGISGNMNV